MRRFVGIYYILILFFLLTSCFRREDELMPAFLPAGTPVTMYLRFESPQPMNVEIGTKAESSRVDESRIHDLYVMIFDAGGTKFYGRYFSYEHMISSLQDLDSQNNEGWYVENSENSRGVVKISTVSRECCTLVLLANISNTITSLNGMDAIDCLADIGTMEELLTVKVTLEQEIVNRSDLFLMLGKMDNVNTGSIVWGEFSGNTPVYNRPNNKYQVELTTVDAKVKFRIKYDATFISDANSTPRYWQVFNVPDRSYLFEQDANPEGTGYFNTEEAYFEGTETDNDGTWHVFSFYMLDNRQTAKASITDSDYYKREKQQKTADPDNPGHVINGDWVYAPANGTYVQFDVVLGLTDIGIQEILHDPSLNHALTSEGLYTVHMGNFTNNGVDDYSVKRGNSYIYNITIVNSTKIYVEVMNPESSADPEDQPGQEGSLLLATNEIVNCDAHYSYHSITFNYNASIAERGVSWYVKTPFSEGGATWNPEHNDWDFDCKDFLWVKFSVNEVEGGSYKDTRIAYPGDSKYDPSWIPGTNQAYASTANPLDRAELMDIHQLIQYIFDQTKKENQSTGSSDFKNGLLKVTAYIDEYYYVTNPLNGNVEADLWRSFVNAKPRELHILSDAHYSQDSRSDVITASHSIIQQSIQTIYNIYSPDLTSIWGTEHVDEMSYKERKKYDQNPPVWPWWPEGRALSASANNDENGRVNTAALWGLNSSPQWSSFMNYAVANEVPELNNDYQYLAYSCLTRNRDNDGDGVIDPDEVRWYVAAVNQLIGMWVGNESLTPSARIYQPVNANNKTDGLQWRSWIIASTVESNINQPRIIRAEEAATKSFYGGDSYKFAFDTAEEQDMVSTVRCVRNIGTYQDDGKLKDISYAPYDVFVDQYYEIPAGTDANGKAKPNNDGTYTYRFSRLNPKSIREYTSEDFPEHEEYSQHNRVYLELNLQSASNQVSPDGTSIARDLEQLNKNITAAGYNEYCPPGYRLPNMTELLMMVALQPSSYWGYNNLYPGRTFFSRGKLGSNLTDSEQVKLGWGFDKGIMHLKHVSHTITGLRCVRDLNRTGDITGKIIVPGGDKLHLGDDVTIQLNFSSQGSGIKTLGLFLVYVQPNGSETTISIPTNGISLSGVTLRDEVNWQIPNELPLLGNMSIRATVRNSAGISKTFEAPINILSPVFTSVRLLHCDYNETSENPPFPVMLTASSPSAPITGWTLRITEPDGEVFSVNLPAQVDDSNYWTYTYQYTYDLNTLQTGTYSFQLETTISSGPMTRSDAVNMEILKVNYWPNPGTTGTSDSDDYHEATDIINLWGPQQVNGMDFKAGDFIEANMDVSHCTYLEVMKTDDPNTRDDARTIGRDNLISVGLTDTDGPTGNMSVPNIWHVYYPAHDGGANSGRDYLRFNPSRQSGNNLTNGLNYTWYTGPGFILESANKYMPDPSKKQHFRIDKYGVFWNNQIADFSHWNDGTDRTAALTTFDKITSANTLYIGSTQGVHHSRAGYMFVRVVHNGGGLYMGSNTGFEEDPQEGGNL